MKVSFMEFWHRLTMQLTLRRILITVGLTVLFVSSALAGSFLWPRTLHFSYASANCFTNPMFLPDLMGYKPSAGYAVAAGSELKIFNYPIYAGSSCISPTRPPKEGSAEVVQITAANTVFLAQSIHVVPLAMPTATMTTRQDRPVSTGKPITFDLNEADKVFDYAATANAHTAACTTQGRMVSCDVSKLSLLQSTKYEVALTRQFHGAASGTVYLGSISTVAPVVVASSSIPAGSMVYDVPTSLTLALNRPASEASGAHLHLATGGADLPITSEIHGSSLVVHFTSPLPRSTSLALDIDSLAASDGGHLDAPYRLAFNVSGGPKVRGINIGSYKVSPTGSIVLTFDSKLAESQPVGEFVKLQAGAARIPTAIAVRGNVVTLTPKIALPRCSGFSVIVADGLKNEAGISGGSAYNFASRTICQTSFSIGTSVQGRPITAYSFGSGPSKIIYIGDTHGNERSSTYLLNSWVDELEKNYARIPSNRTIIVVPTINPDGFAANSRTNANNVDLNRNFPANDWKAAVIEPNHALLPAGGGTAPLSEPESAAVTSLIASQQPRLVLTYHAVAGIVLPNNAGDSDALAHVYDKLSTVHYLSGTATGYFDYDTTGAFEGWTYDKLGISTLLIELFSNTDNEFSGNQSAMWEMAQLP